MNTGIRLDQGRSEKEISMMYREVPMMGMDSVKILGFQRMTASEVFYRIISFSYLCSKWVWGIQVYLCQNTILYLLNHTCQPFCLLKELLLFTLSFRISELTSIVPLSNFLIIIYLENSCRSWAIQIQNMSL